jgi:hypothetical protein
MFRNKLLSSILRDSVCVVDSRLRTVVITQKNINKHLYSERDLNHLSQHTEDRRHRGRKEKQATTDEKIN